MSGIAVAIDWGQPDAGEASVRKMLAAMPHRAPDGTRVASTPHCVLGFALRATTVRERAAPQPLHDPEAGLWLVADARVDNRDEVARALGLPAPPASDAELLLRGLASMGAALASRLEGDFAFAAWDERRRVLLLARDVMGLRPLFWRASGRGLLMASEVDALLEAGGMADVEPAAVLDYLVSRNGPVARTFFRGIQRLPPGHVLEAADGRVRDLGLARPPPLHRNPPPPAQDVPEFRRRLWKAVSVRLESNGPVVLSLSGGLDSSAIACVAEDLRRRDPGGPSLILASGVIDGFSKNDTPYLDAVVSRVGFRAVRWDALAAAPAAPAALPRAYPWRNPLPAAALRALDVARDAGSRVLLSGTGGDEALTEAGVLEDLARHGRLLTLARETLRARPYTATPGPRLLAWALRSAAPAWARRVFRAVRPRRPPPRPAWLGPDLLPLWPPPDSPRQEPVPSRVQANLCRILDGESLFGAVEFVELAAARAGVQLRLPFLDRPLVEWLHSIPWQRRVPRGLMKRLLREAMAGTWPEEMSRRRAVSVDDQYLIWSVTRSLPLLAPAVEGSRWEAARFVDRGEARRLLASARGGTAGWQECIQLWDIVALETWLRGLSR